MKPSESLIQPQEDLEMTKKSLGSQVENSNIYGSEVSNRTNYHNESQSSMKRHELTSILNQGVDSQKAIQPKGSNDSGNYNSGEDMMSLEGHFDTRPNKGQIHETNKSCMNLAKISRAIFSKEETNYFKPNKNKDLLTSSMIVNPGNSKIREIFDSSLGRDSKAFSKKKNNRGSVRLNVPNKYSAKGKSPESSFMISKKTLSPITMNIPGESFMRENIPKVRSSIGKFYEFSEYCM